MPEREQQPGDAAHARAGDADEMDLQFTADEDFREDLAGIHS